MRRRGSLQQESNATGAREVPINGAKPLLGAEGREAGWAQGRHLVLADGQVGDPVHPHLALDQVWVPAHSIRS